MKITKKYKAVALIALCLVLVLSFASCSSNNTSDASGKCTDTIEWKYVSSDKTLEISGTGAIPNYKTSAETPWTAALAVAENVEIEEGITAIGDRALYGMGALEDIDLPSTLTTIGDYALAYATSLETVDLPEALASVGSGAFEGCSSLKSISLGASVSSLGERAFAFCPSLESASILGSASIGSETFFNCHKLDTLILHSSISEDKVSKDAFKNTNFTYSDAEIAADTNTTVTVTVEYFYEDGREAATSVTKTDLKIGDNYEIQSPKIEGYVADKPVVSGAASASDLTVKVTYKAEVVETEPVTTDTEPVADEKEENGIGGYIGLAVMIIVLVGIAVGGFFLVRYEKKNEEKAKNQNKAKNRKQK